MSIPFVLGTAIIRLLLAIASDLGILSNNYRDFALRDDDLEEAKHLADYINARTILLSWPVLTLVVILSRAEQLSATLSPLRILVMFFLWLVLSAAILAIRPRIYREYLKPFKVFVVVTSLDVVFKLFVIDGVSELLSRSTQ